MARGWESKDVESRQELAEADRRSRSDRQLSAEEQEREARRHRLLLDRTRVAAELEATPHERRKHQLRAALGHLDSELRRLN
jgi:hypothetical protein